MGTITNENLDEVIEAKKENVALGKVKNAVQGLGKAKDAVLGFLNEHKGTLVKIGVVGALVTLSVIEPSVGATLSTVVTGAAAADMLGKIKNASAKKEVEGLAPEAADAETVGGTTQAAKIHGTFAMKSEEDKAAVRKHQGIIRRIKRDKSEPVDIVGEVNEQLAFNFVTKAEERSIPSVIAAKAVMGIAGMNINRLEPSVERA